MDRYTVGVDFGTLSGRAVVVRVSDGAEAGAALHEYRHGVMDDVLAATGEALAPDWALQNPQDYCEVLRTAVPQAVAAAGRIERDVYQPDGAWSNVYEVLYAEYVRLHNYFGTGTDNALHRLRRIRNEALMS